MGAAEQKGPEQGDKNSEASFQCNICFEGATGAVITQCGHLYCWECLYGWMSTGKNTCPVCQGAVSRETVIPIYGRGDEEKKDPRNTTPNRPRGNRQEARTQNRSNFSPFGNANAGGGNFQFHAGFFPFGLFGFSFNNFGGGMFQNDRPIGGNNQGDGDPPAQQGVNGDNPYDPDEWISKVFLGIGIATL